MLRDLNRVDLNPGWLIVFLQHSGLRYLHGPFLEARGLQNLAYVSCELNNLEVSDRVRGRYEGCRLRWEAE